MGNTASGNKGCFIKPKKAWRLLKTADEGNVTAYIFGGQWFGKDDSWSADILEHVSTWWWMPAVSDRMTLW